MLAFPKTTTHCYKFYNIERNLTKIFISPGIKGALLSTVTVFFNLVPWRIDFNKAPRSSAPPLLGAKTGGGAIIGGGGAPGGGGGGPGIFNYKI